MKLPFVTSYNKFFEMEIPLPQEYIQLHRKIDVDFLNPKLTASFVQDTYRIHRCEFMVPLVNGKSSIASVMVYFDEEWESKSPREVRDKQINDFVKHYAAWFFSFATRREYEF